MRFGSIGRGFAVVHGKETGNMERRRPGQSLKEDEETHKELSKRVSYDDDIDQLLPLLQQISLISIIVIPFIDTDEDLPTTPRSNKYRICQW